MLTFDIKENSDLAIEITFETPPYFKERPYGLSSVQCGSLVFSLPISHEKNMHEYEKNGVERTFPYCDYDYRPISDRSFAYSDQDLQVQSHDVRDVPFSSEHPPVTVLAKVKPIDWG